MVDTPAPWHHWPLALLAILFYAVGTCDFAFTSLEFGFYLDRFTSAQIDFAATLPVWLEWIWGLAVFGGLLGAVLLWRRNRFSVILLFVGFALITFLGLWMTIFARPSLGRVMGFQGVYVMAGTAAIAFVFYLYGRWERRVRKL